MKRMFRAMPGAAALLAALPLMAAADGPVPPAAGAPAAAPVPPPVATPADVKPLEPGDPAPAFRLQGSDGKTYSLEDFKGKKAVVLAWFPKAFTGG